MKKKIQFNPETADRSHVLHEFFSLHKEFFENLSYASAKRLIHFLKDAEKSKSIIQHALFDPHPKTHGKIENDIENTIIALTSWVEGKVDVEVPSDFLNDLKKWIMN